MQETAARDWTTGGVAAIVPAISDSPQDQSCDHRGQHPVSEAICEIGPEGHLNLRSKIRVLMRSMAIEVKKPKKRWPLIKSAKLPSETRSPILMSLPYPHMVMAGVSHPSPTHPTDAGLFLFALALDITNRPS